MACCGQNRQTLNQGTTSGASYVTVPVTRAVAPGGVFEYTGDRVLTVVGQGTGFHYRFAGRGARFTVDARDRRSLSMVPQLREIKTSL